MHLRIPVHRDRFLPPPESAPTMTEMRSITRTNDGSSLSLVQPALPIRLAAVPLRLGRSWAQASSVGAASGFHQPAKRRTVNGR